MAEIKTVRALYNYGWNNSDNTRYTCKILELSEPLATLQKTPGECNVDRNAQTCKHCPSGQRYLEDSYEEMKIRGYDLQSPSQTVILWLQTMNCCLGTANVSHVNFKINSSKITRYLSTHIVPI